MARDVLGLAMDAGGTMTDTFIIDTEGNFVIGKAPTTPWDESEGFIESTEDAFAQWDLDEKTAFSQFEVSVYAGTTMLNTLLTRTGRRIGLITSKGFEDILLMEQGRQVWSGYSHADRLHAATHVHNDPLVPRRRTRGVSERTDMFGEVTIPLYERDARAAAEEILAQDVEGVAVCFLHSYANPRNEKRMEAILKEAMAAQGIDVPIFLSSHIRPVIRENQRVNATTIEAYAADPVRQQLHNVEESAKGRGFRKQLTTMLSYGGLANIRHPRLHETLISGPIGGMLGAQYISQILGVDNVLAVDMGGTSYDFGLITNGTLNLNNEPELARFRLALPSIELDSIRGGAGLYLSIDPITNRIVMGPEGAGANPGPVCFDKGNLQSTVTDCLAVNGYLNKDNFLGGKVKLNIELAERELKSQIADKLGLSVNDAADGILKLWLQQALEATKRAIHVRGGDVADYTIMGYGGAGPMVLAGVSENQPFKGVVTFPFAAAFSAFGCTTTDYSHRYTRSSLFSLTHDADAAAKQTVAQGLSELWNNLEAEAHASFESEGMDLTKIEYKRIAFVRYGGQLDDVEVPFDADWKGSAADVDTLLDSFEDLYTKMYVKAARYPKAGYAILQVALVASIETRKPEFPILADKGPTPPASAYKDERPIYIDGEWNTARIYDIDEMEPGNIIDGLAILEHPATTLLVPANRRARMDERKFVWLEKI
ncbi:MAG: hydantoinase/oxoprolinase family protein [Gammaproteobacteria bacterium]|nr:hydantoinase/oxoprolinase family protein [Gammaproteobacteria bacterium]